VPGEGVTGGAAKAEFTLTETVEFTEACVLSVVWSIKYHLPVAVEAEVVKL
jgi:hypothetical protein